MTKKVSLDTFDIEEPALLTDQKERAEVPLPDKKLFRWYRSRMFIAAGAIFLMFCAVSAALYFILRDKQEVRQEAAQSISPAIIGETAGGSVDKTGLIVKNLNDFLIPLGDNGKNFKMLAIDVALEIDSTRLVSVEEKIVPVRAAIYEALGRDASRIGRGKEGMDAARERIAVKLEEVLGKEFIGKVWITKFIVL